MPNPQSRSQKIYLVGNISYFVRIFIRIGANLIVIDGRIFLE